MGASNPNGRDHFNNEKRAVVEIMKRISKSNNIFGVIQYDSAASIKSSLKEYTDDRRFREKVDSLSWRRDGINLKAGLEIAKMLFDTESRPKARKVLVVFTDGRLPNSVEDLKNTSEPLKKKGIKIISVAVGDEVEDKKLNELSSINKIVKPKKGKKAKEYSQLIEEEIFSGRTCGVASFRVETTATHRQNCQTLSLKYALLLVDLVLAILT